MDRSAIAALMLAAPTAACTDDPVPPDLAPRGPQPSAWPRGAAARDSRW